MNTAAPRTSLLTRIAAAAMATCMTAAVFSAVVSISEPQRSQLAALDTKARSAASQQSADPKLARHQRPQNAAPVQVAQR